MDIVDFHSHILPGADHGSSSLDTSLSQLKIAKEFGVNRVIITPHYYPHRENPDNFINRRERAYSHLIRHLDDEYPDVRLGAEVLICDNIEEIPLLEHLCVKGSKVILLELPFTDFSRSFIDSIKCLILQGYKVVLAHADRYCPDDIDSLIAVGAKIQLNADSLVSFFIKKHIKRWLDSGCVCAIGSDIHGTDKKAYKNFNTAMKRLKKYMPNIKKASDDIWNILQK